jgi:hypothetical protein
VPRVAPSAPADAEAAAAAAADVDGAIRAADEVGKVAAAPVDT